MRTKQTTERLLEQIKAMQEKLDLHQEKIIAKKDSNLEGGSQDRWMPG
jgi:hypothetical protein